MGRRPRLGVLSGVYCYPGIIGRRSSGVGLWRTGYSGRDFAKRAGFGADQQHVSKLSLGSESAALFRDQYSHRHFSFPGCLYRRPSKSAQAANLDEWWHGTFAQSAKSFWLGLGSALTDQWYL